MATLRHLTSSMLLAATPALMLLWGSGAACQLDDSFVKSQQLPCEDDQDCSEPGYCCISGLCDLHCDVGPDAPCTTEDQDRDGDGYGTGDYRQNCQFPERDTDDDCAACTPVARESCDGFDNDSDGLIDEPVPCDGTASACPRTLSISHLAQWACREGVCTVVPLELASEACQRVTFECVNNAYDTSQADLHGCYGPDICDGLDNDADGTVDEPIPCGDSVADCPLDTQIPLHTQWSCRDSECVLISLLPMTTGCANVEVKCIDGNYYTQCVTP